MSKHLNSLDAKGRTSVPANFRALIMNNGGNEVVAYPSIKHQCIEVCSMQRMAELIRIVQSLDPYSEERDALEAVIFGEAVQLPFDVDGRVVLPKALIEYANICKQAYFVGKGDVFEIWNIEDFEKYLSKAKDIARSSRFLLKNKENA